LRRSRTTRRPEIIQQVRGQAPAEAGPAEAPPKKLTNIQRIRRIEEVIETEIRPMLQHDGGDIELVDVIGTRVQVAFRGHCAWCRAKDFTLDGTVGAKLRELVDTDIEVEDVGSSLGEE
jgi:NifU-like protein